MSGQRPAPGERWTICSLDHVHWGANGGAGLLFRYTPSQGEPRILLARRSRLVDEGGSWGIPGGAIRDGETAEMAARREVLEEISSLPAHRITGVEEQDCGGGWHFSIFTADVEEQFDAYCQQETDATGWFTVAAVAKLQLHPGLRRWLVEYATATDRHRQLPRQVPAGASSFSEALRVGAEVFHELRYTLLARGRGAAIGSDGGYAPDLESNESALETLVVAITSAGYERGRDVWIGIDATAGQLRAEGAYLLAHEGRRLSSDELSAYYEEITDRYPVLILEDGMAEDDWDGWRELTARLGHGLELAGDDVFVTTDERLREGINARVANAIVIKPNQDTTICDLAVATRCGQIKAGAPSRERVAKYNRLLRIEEMLGNDAVFPGIAAFSHGT